MARIGLPERVCHGLDKHLLHGNEERVITVLLRVPSYLYDV